MGWGRRTRIFQLGKRKSSDVVTSDDVIDPIRRNDDVFLFFENYSTFIFVYTCLRQIIHALLSVLAGYHYCQVLLVMSRSTNETPQIKKVMNSRTDMLTRTCRAEFTSDNQVETDLNNGTTV